MKASATQAMRMTAFVFLNLDKIDKFLMREQKKCSQMPPSLKYPSVPPLKLENHSTLPQTSSEDQTKCDVFDMTMIFLFLLK